jgi:hypothetical protein
VPIQHHPFEPTRTAKAYQKQPKERSHNTRRMLYETGPCFVLLESIYVGPVKSERSYLKFQEGETRERSLLTVGHDESSKFLSCKQGLCKIAKPQLQTQFTMPICSTLVLPLAHVQLHAASTAHQSSFSPLPLPTASNLAILTPCRHNCSRNESRSARKWGVCGQAKSKMSLKFANELL